jgi:MFS family permease
MHAPDLPPAELPTGDGAWWRDLNGYQWFVFVVACLGWSFDTMDQRIFIMSREAAMTQLLGYERDGKGGLSTYHGQPVGDQEAVGEAEGRIKKYSSGATMVFMLGWATGGLFFGVMGDRWGRARTMLLTILLYSAFTGLSALSRSWWDFMVYRFITGMGVGGEFAAGVALVAEVVPNRARPFALGLLQALSAVGNITGSLLSWVIMPFGWQWMFLVGTIPALLVVAVMRRLKEPETWQKAKAAGQKAVADGARPQMGSLSELLGERRWLRHTVLGVLLAVAGVIGLWGVGFWTPELISEALRGRPAGELNRIRAWGTALQDVGAFFGIYVFSILASRIGRRGAFGLSFVAALAATVLVFGFLRTELDVYWMLPVLGFCNLAVFGGYAIYFPELYPTRLRSTGTGFCYNVARYLAAVGPYWLGYLGVLYGSLHPTLLSGFGIDSPFRYAALTVALIYLLGIAVLPFAPETKGQPLPE